eukprot:2510331-Rhodomonas_salina.1
MEESEEVSEESEEGSMALSASRSVQASLHSLLTPAQESEQLKAAQVSPPQRNYIVAESMSKLLLILEGSLTLSVAHLRALGQTLKHCPKSVKALVCVFLEWNAAKDTYSKTDARASMKLSRALSERLCP